MYLSLQVSHLILQLTDFLTIIKVAPKLPLSYHLFILRTEKCHITNKTSQTSNSSLKKMCHLPSVLTARSSVSTPPRTVNVLHLGFWPSWGSPSSKYRNMFLVLAVGWDSTLWHCSLKETHYTSLMPDEFWALSEWYLTGKNWTHTFPMPLCRPQIPNELH